MESNKITDKQQTQNAWYQCAVTTAVISAAFVFVVLVLFIWNYIQIRLGDITLEEDLSALKAQVQERPDDQQLLSRIRERDLQYRQEWFQRQDRARKGSYMLIGGIAFFLICLKWADTQKNKLPHPGRSTGKSSEHIRQATFARWSATAAALIFGSAALLFATKPTIDLTVPESDETPFPSMEQVNKNWPYFRGPNGDGISAYTNIPVKWNAATGEGIRWKTKVPLPGNNSPVVWDDRVFLSGADPNQNQVYCFDTESGELLWTGNVVHTSGEQLENIMEDTGYAAPTTATDGRRVYAIFVTGDVGCFDFDGRKVWEKSLGIPQSSYGYASSLVMYQNLLLIQFDQGYADDGLSSMIALDGLSGRVIWQTKRPVSNSWTSPIVVKVGEQYQLITAGDPFVIGYNPATGEELWRVNCLSADSAPSPIYAGGFVFVIEPYSKLVAIRPDGRGDVTETHIAWKIEEGGPDICSPASNGELIFMLSSEGWLSSYKLSDQKKVWEKDLKGFFTASPSLVGNKLYLLSQKGAMHIAEPDSEYKELAVNELGEKCNASPAFVDGRIYIRGVENLYCIGNK